MEKRGRPPRVFRFPFGRHQVERDLAEEMRFHLEMRADDLRQRGARDEEAHALALARFGDVESVRRRCLREGLAMDRRRQLRCALEELVQDALYALRSLRNQPAFAVAALFTLTLGLGATTALFSLLDQVVLRPLPFPDPERLVWISTLDGAEETVSSPGLVQAWARQGKAVESLAGLYGSSFALVGGDLPERVRGLRVSADFFPTFGVQPLIGRAFLPEEDRPGSDRVVVLSQRLWQRHFAADRSVVGRDIELDGVPHTVLGVMPAIFDSFGDLSVDLWRPLALAASQEENFAAGYLQVVARLAAGTSPEEAAARLLAVNSGLDLRDREGEPLGVRLRPLATELAKEVSGPLWRLFGATLAVLLIGCVNLAHLLLAWGERRREELAVRAALGAGRGRLVRQLLTESLVLSVLGALCGFFLAHALVLLFKAAAPPGIPRLAEAGVDGTAFFFALAMACGVSLLCGLLPARRAARVDLSAGLHVATIDRGNRRTLRGMPRLQSLLVGGEVAMAVILLTAAGLLLRSSWKLDQVDPGFAHRGVLTAALSLPRAAYPEPRRMVETWSRLVENARRLPGVDSAALVSRVPLGGGLAGLDFRLVGQSQEDEVGSRIRIASAGYLQTLGIPLLAGREFTDGDNHGAERVVIINESLAKKLGQGARQDALLGQSVITEGYTFIDGEGEPYRWRVVGIAGDVYDEGLRREPQPAVYLPLGQTPAGPWDWIERQMLLAVRAPNEAMGLTPSLRRAVQAVDPALPLYDVQTLEQRFQASRASERLQTSLLTALGIVGLILSAVGLYGVISFSVSRRRREIGLRMALGANPQAVRRLVNGQVLGPLLAGLAAGAAGSIAIGRLLAAQLVGVSPVDVPTLLSVTVVLFLVAGLAADGPTRRALAVDPSAALRAD